MNKEDKSGLKTEFNEEIGTLKKMQAKIKID